MTPLPSGDRPAVDEIVSQFAQALEDWRLGVDASPYSFAEHFVRSLSASDLLALAFGARGLEESVEVVLRAWGMWSESHVQLAKEAVEALQAPQAGPVSGARGQDPLGRAPWAQDPSAERQGDERRWFVYRRTATLPWYCWQADDPDDPSLNRKLFQQPDNDEAIVAELRARGYQVFEVTTTSRRPTPDGPAIESD